MKTAPKRQSPLSSISLMIFFETMGSLLSSGITALDSLKLMVDDAQQEREKSNLQSLLKALETQYELHSAMEQTALFPAYAVNTVRLAERTGSLEEGCASLAEYYEKENQLSARIRNAITTPFILICIIALVVAFLVSAILPVFTRIYMQMGIDIEANTMVRLALTLGSVVLWVMFGLLVVGIAGFGFSKTSAGKEFFSKFAESSPFTRKFNEELAMARFTSMFAMLITSGDEVSMALTMAAKACGHRQITARLEACCKSVIGGESLGVVLLDSGLFNPAYAGMLKSGIRSGATTKVMKKLSELYEQNAERILARFLALIEPLLIGLLSVVVGVILLCIMLPFIGMMASIG